MELAVRHHPASPFALCYAYIIEDCYKRNNNPIIKWKSRLFRERDRQKRRWYNSFHSIAILSDTGMCFAISLFANAAI